MTTALPPVAPDVAASAVEGLTSRLRKKLDAAVERCAATPVTDDGGTFRVPWGEDAEVTLLPGPSGAITDPDQARCTCLLAPRCPHRAAVLTACPLADAVTEPAAVPDPDGPAPEPAPDPAPSPVPEPPSAARRSAAAGLWAAAAAVLAAGVPAADAVAQAEVLRAAHTARLAGLLRAEAAALRVVRGLRAARAGHDGHRLADLTAALRDLLLTSGRIAAADPDPSLIGTARRDYRPGGGLRVHGVFREPVISATRYGGVVTRLVGEDGRWFSVADVRPGGPARAVGAATATVALAPALDHAALARGGLLVTGATVSPEGRLGTGRGVRATPLPGRPWEEGPPGALFTRPLAEAVAARLAVGPDATDMTGADEGAADEPLGCDLVITGARGDQVFARELRDGAPAGPVIRLVPAHGHPSLAHTANLRRFASRPGLCVRVVARLDPDRTATLRPLAAGPVPGSERTLRLPDAWLGRADLGYDRVEGAHLPPATTPGVTDGGAAADPLGDSPLWRVRRLVELAVAGGRRAVAEAGRDDAGARVPLRRAGLRTAAGLCAALTAEADRRGRDVFGRLADSDPDGYARAWLATAVYLAATERALIAASWREEDEREPASV
ncbi:SWIM zinc finger family protein [Streptomyces specialis]|uniref:SWIM zinc finger family protein n=1 Tax=Streptomyces specialis TaxID=498367 RepID=UPI00073F6E94|nr:SWIM zinc finger family protein [Streptomyces specialis]